MRMQRFRCLTWTWPIGGLDRGDGMGHTFERIERR